MNILKRFHHRIRYLHFLLPIFPEKKFCFRFEQQQCYIFVMDINKNGKKLRFSEFM